ncbi:hypothetical protein Glove_168g207 [Diversispora epigaea]|uniref:Uncharacterized protein n=1 Tax=Diversispora epigaea TaxID=1348612 RepID=A0A397IQ37_9GLOM|nr:hypothetical protein Glove_168g207 [Diversispora epigaea]
MDLNEMILYAILKIAKFSILGIAGAMTTFMDGPCALGIGIAIYVAAQFGGKFSVRPNI